MDYDFIISHPELLLLVLAPLFIICMACEWFFGVHRAKLPSNAQYYLPEIICNFVLAGMHQISDLLTGFAVASLYLWLFNWRLFDIEMSVSTFLFLVVAQDFLYYWFHRASHRVRWMWSAHVAHHSSENMNFSTAFRQSLLYPFAGMWLFWVPLVMIGFEPSWVMFAVLLNLGLQFFVHTQAIGKLGVIEWVFNTPSHHRVHHGRNPQYIDRNYAGVLIIWDRLFGTYAHEEERVIYGITKPASTFNPLHVTFDEFRDMWRECLSSNLTLRQRWVILFGPP